LPALGRGETSVHPCREPGSGPTESARGKNTGSRVTTSQEESQGRVRYGCAHHDYRGGRKQSGPHQPPTESCQQGKPSIGEGSRREPPHHAPYLGKPSSRTDIRVPPEAKSLDESPKGGTEGPTLSLTGGYLKRRNAKGGGQGESSPRQAAGVSQGRIKGREEGKSVLPKNSSRQKISWQERQDQGAHHTVSLAQARGGEGVISNANNRKVCIE